MKFSRRHALKALGASSLLPMLHAGSARSQPADIPKRVLFIYVDGDGMVRNDWEPRPVNGADTILPRQFALGPNFDVLSDYRADSIFFDNLDIVSKTYDTTPARNAHIDGATHALCAALRLTDEQAGGPSIDQVIAQQLRQQGVTTTFPSVEVFIDAEMAYNSGFGGPRKINSTTSPGVYVDALGRPDEIFDRLFPPGTPPADTSGLLLRQSRIFNFLRGEHSRIASRLSTTERIKLDAHMQNLSDLEARRSQLLGNSDRRALWPERSSINEAIGLDWSYNAPRATTWFNRYNIAAELNFKVIAHALHADLTRVATVSLSLPPMEGAGYTAGMFDSTDFHDLTHKVNDFRTLPQALNPDARAMMNNSKRIMLSHVKTLLDTLAALPELDGSRLLDHTLVVFTSQIALGDHSTKRLPWFTVGNLDGALDTGKLIDFGRVDDPRTPDPIVTLGRSHADLFLTVAHVMGVELPSFGFADVSRGLITEMLTT